MPTLSADVARASSAVRETYLLKMADLIRKISSVLGGAEADRERRAWSIVALMIGAIEIARALPDGDDAKRAIDHALETALSQIG